MDSDEECNAGLDGRVRGTSFVRSDGTPMVFYVAPCEKRKQIEDLIIVGTSVEGEARTKSKGAGWRR